MRLNLGRAVAGTAVSAGRRINRSSGEPDAVCRSLLIVLARAGSALDATRDHHAAAFETAARASLAAFGCDVPWAEGDSKIRSSWADERVGLTEQHVVDCLVAGGMASIARGQFQGAAAIYRWLCSALLDTSDLHLLWGLGLMRAEHFHEARGCFARVDRQDDFIQALMTICLLPSALESAVQSLQRMRITTARQAVRDVVSDVLRAVDVGADELDLSEDDLAKLSK